MTKAVRNSASEMTTELGGAVAVRSAVRSSDSTTTIRVNEVIITRIDGASDRTVRSAINWITRSVRPAPWPKLTLMSWACAGLDSRSAIATAVVRRTQAANPRDLKSFLVCSKDLPSLARDYPAATGQAPRVAARQPSGYPPSLRQWP